MSATPTFTLAELQALASKAGGLERRAATADNNVTVLETSRAKAVVAANDMSAYRYQQDVQQLMADVINEYAPHLIDVLVMRQKALALAARVEAKAVRDRLHAVVAPEPVKS